MADIHKCLVIIEYMKEGQGLTALTLGLQVIPILVVPGNVNGN